MDVNLIKSGSGLITDCNDDHSQDIYMGEARILKDFCKIAIDKLEQTRRGAEPAEEAAKLPRIDWSARREEERKIPREIARAPLPIA